MPDPAEELLDALASARIVAGRTAYRRGGRSGVLRAAADPRREADGVRVDEEGRWTGPRTRLEVRDATRWTRLGPRRLRLAHLRRGADAPVELGVLRRRGPGVWVAEAPHVCGEDRYRARLDRRGSVVTLAWRVEGPEKAGRVRRTYRATA